MRIVFAHDHKFRKIDGEFYSTGGLSNEVLSRYATIFDSIVVISRVMDCSVEHKNLSKIENEKVEIIDGYSKDNNIEIHKIIKDADAVIARLPSRLGNKAIRYARKYQKPYLVEIVGCAWDSYWNHSFSGKLFSPYMFLKTKSIIQNASHALYVTKEFLQNRYPCNGISISCSDVELAKSDDNVLHHRLSSIEKKFSSNDALIIGTVGALNVKYKGQEYIIRAIAKLNQNGFNYEYHLVGGGDSEYLRRIANKFGVSDKVKFIGTLSHENIFDFLDSIDVYAQPSNVEGLPRALLEAMSRGCPSIGTQIGGIPELIEEKWIFQSENIEELYGIFVSLNKEKMLQAAKYNFKKANEYKKEKLDFIRTSFYKLFRDEIGGKLSL